MLRIPTLLAMVDKVAPGERKLDGLRTQNLGLTFERYSVELSEWAARYELNQDHGDASLCKSSTDMRRFDDPFMAETIALYDSSCILVAAARVSLPVTRQRAFLEEEIIQHSESILSSVDSVERENVWCNAGGPFRLVHPLKVVVCSSPCKEQVASARSVLGRWSAQYGMEGICNLKETSTFHY